MSPHDAVTRQYSQPLPEAGDDFDGVPTRVAFTPEEAPTTQVDLAHLDPSSPMAPLPLQEPQPVEEPPQAYEPAHTDEHPHADEYRGWGPRVPDEMLQTTFFHRDRPEHPPEPHADHGYEPVVDTPPGLRNPGERDAERLTGTFVAAHDRVRRGGAVIIGAVCIAAGVIIGTAIGLSAGPGSGEEIPSTATASVTVPVPPLAPEPVPAPEPRVAPAPAPQPRVEPEPAVEAQAVEPEPAVAPEPAAPAEPAAPEVDPLEEARIALRDADAEGVADALSRARTAGADAGAIARLDAELAVLRGDGAIAIERLREVAGTHREAPLYVALGRVLVQAERDRDASDAFRTALELDPNDVDAHLGLSGIDARAAAIRSARRHHRDAVAAAGERVSDDALLDARIRAADALILLESGEIASALREAEAARRLDSRSSEAALLMARIAGMRNQPADAHLRHAVAGRAPAPMAIALLAQSLDGDEACDLASRYLERAPRGFDASAMRRIAQRCR